MNKTNNQNLRPRAQSLRHEMTKAEKHLWFDYLKSLPMTVNRQKVFGYYIADFYIASAKLIIELDGKEHYTEKHSASDRERDSYFESLGIKVLRYDNIDVYEHFRDVCKDIEKHLVGCPT